jgi:RimJ/RimL family protein N-acetyltransferase
MSENKINPIMIEFPMPIATPRLILRNVQVGDGTIMHEAKEESFAELHQWMLWAKERGSVEENEIVARENYANFILRKDMMILGFEKDSGRLVISTGLHNPDFERGYIEIGYWVRTSATGKGYATESTNALIRYAFNQLGMKKVGIAHADGNEGSKRVIEKLGFQKEGVFERASLLNDGRMVAQHWYARFDEKDLPYLEVKW